LILYNEAINGIEPLFSGAMEEAQKRVDFLAKPPGSLGKLESIAVKLSGITGNIINKVEKKCTIVMCADNGIFEEGVSSCPQIITVAQSVNFIKGITGVAVLSKHAGADLKVVDIGINYDVEYPGLINKKIRKSTWNISKGPAMTRSEAIEAIEIGIDMVRIAKEEGYSLLGTGEMGICNTSTSSAVLMSFTECSIETAVGRGAGLTDKGFDNKKAAITRAIQINSPDKNDAVDVLTKVGGFDIAGIAGCFIGAAYYRVPILVDGFISAAAALIACKINPLVKDYLIASHYSEEPGFILAMNELELSPLLDLQMRLGEGSGCPLAFNIVSAACAMISNMATFAEAEINDEYLEELRQK